MDILNMSVTTDKGNRYVLVIVDCFSRWSEACPLPNKTAVAVADEFFQLPVWHAGGHTFRHESTVFSPYQLMFGEECTLPMDVGLPRRNKDSLDPIQNPYALWVRDALEVAYDQVLRQKRLHDKRAVKRACACYL